MTNREIVGATTVIGGGGAGYGTYKFYGDFNSVSKKLQDEGFVLLDFDISDKNGVNYKIWKFLTLSYGRNKNESEKISKLDISIEKPDDKNLDSAIYGLIKKCQYIYNTSFHKSDFQDLKSKAEKWCVGNVGTKRISNNEVPIIFLTESDSYWSRAYDRYFLEVKDSDKLPNIGGKEERLKWSFDDSKKSKLKEDCSKLLMSKSDDNNYSRGKWCVQYRSVKDSLGETKFKDSSDKASWSNKYDWNQRSNGDQELKEVLAALFNSSRASSSGGKTQEDKKFYAVYSWCTKALNGSSSRMSLVIDACPQK